MHNPPAHSRGGRLRHGGGPRPAARPLAIAILSGITLLSATPAGHLPAHPRLSMAISPPRLTVPAGQVTKIQRLEIENRGSAPLHVHTELSAFVQRADGSITLQPSTPYSAVTWIKITPARFQVRPGAKRFIRIRIHVPAHPEPGDYHLAIVFLVPQASHQGSIHVAEGIGVPTLITVPGPVIDKVHIVTLAAPNFSAGGPIPITATIRESGDVHHSFRGARNRLAAVADGARVLFPPLTVLRGSTVNFTTHWDKPPAICICHITTTVTSGRLRTAASATVIIFPVVPAMTGLGVLTLLVLTFLLARRRQRHRLTAAYEAGQRSNVSSGALGG